MFPKGDKGWSYDTIPLIILTVQSIASDNDEQVELNNQNGSNNVPTKIGNNNHKGSSK